MLLLRRLYFSFSLLPLSSSPKPVLLVLFWSLVFQVVSGVALSVGSCFPFRLTGIVTVCLLDQPWKSTHSRKNGQRTDQNIVQVYKFEVQEG